MSSLRPAHGEASLVQTKQMLDELDALMEKMLALPVSDATADAASVETPRVPQLAATLTVLESEPATSAGAEDAEPFTEETAAPARPRLDTATRPAGPHRASAPDESDLEDFVDLQSPDESAPPSLIHVYVPEIKVRPAPPRNLSGLALAPLIWTNAIFDAVTSVLGPLGRWLRTGMGRRLLGVSGVLLLLLAAGWLLKDWMGWTW